MQNDGSKQIYRTCPFLRNLQIDRNYLSFQYLEPQIGRPAQQNNLRMATEINGTCGRTTAFEIGGCLCVCKWYFNKNRSKTYDMDIYIYIYEYLCM